MLNVFVILILRISVYVEYTLSALKCCQKWADKTSNNDADNQFHENFTRKFNFVDHVNGIYDKLVG
jgi:hypothetical protein